MASLHLGVREVEQRRDPTDLGSHVADAELNKMLLAQRRELDPKKRLAIIHDIQRYLADKAYYVYTPHSPQYITHAPHVKGMKYHDGFGLGPRLMFTWLDK